MSNVLSDRAVLMRFSAGLPGEERQDHQVTADVKRDKALGQNAGKWEKRLYPPQALASIKTKINEAREYHNSVTLPFDTGIGILPAVLIMEYGDKMRQFKGEIAALVESDFLNNPQQWIDWAVAEQNGTFDPKNYPGCSGGADGRTVILDADKFRESMRRKFYLRSEPLPVPDAKHFTDTVASLLGTDLESVDLRVKDAQLEGQREVLKRLLTPVKHMAETLLKEKPKIYETLIQNIADIVKLAPKLNLAGDPGLDALVAEVDKLTRYGTESLKGSAATRSEAQKAAAAVMAKLSGYKL